MANQLTPKPGRWWRFQRLTSRFERHELKWLFIGLGVCVLLMLFVLLAGEVMEGDTQAFDTKILLALRDPLDPAKPIGPAWMEGSLLDLTSIGGSTVLGLVIAFVAGFLMLQTRYRTAMVILITSGGGDLLNMIMKHLFARPRPTSRPSALAASRSAFRRSHPAFLSARLRAFS